MKWILIVSVIAFNLMAQSNLSELPADVQKDISTTEDAVSAAKSSLAPKVLVPNSNPNSNDMAKGTAAAVAAKSTIGQDEKSTPIVDKTNAKENEIPLSVETTKKVANSESSFFKIIMVVALLGILTCGTWIFVRKSKFQNIKRNRNEIKILAQHYLGPKKSLAVVRVAGESILVGITDAQINMIKTLSLMDDELPDVTSDNFQTELNTRMNEEAAPIATSKPTQRASSTYNRKSQINTKVAIQDDEMDEFSIRGIKDLVSSKLKNMRSI